MSGHATSAESSPVNVPLPAQASVETSGTSRNSIVRWSLAGLAGLVAFVGIIWLLFALSRWQAVDSVPDLSFNEPIKKAVELRLELASKCFDLTVLLLAAVLGLFIARPGEGRLLTGDRPELVMSCATMFAIAATLFLNHQYTNEVHEALLAGGLVQGQVNAQNAYLPDVIGGHFEEIYRGQWTALGTACALATMTLFSAHRLRPDAGEEVEVKR